jgi:hypothetical protein
LEEIFEALRRAGLDQEMTIRVSGALLGIWKEKQQQRPLGGRPPEDDSQRLALMAALVQGGVSRLKAAAIVTADLLEPARETVRRRVYRKFPSFK